MRVVAKTNAGMTKERESVICLSRGWQNYKSFIEFGNSRVTKFEPIPQISAVSLFLLLCSPDPDLSLSARSRRLRKLSDLALLQMEAVAWPP